MNEPRAGSTRLVIGGYQAVRPRWLGRFVFYWLYVPVVWIMQARMLALLKRNVERAAKEWPPVDNAGRGDARPRAEGLPPAATTAS